MRLIHRRSNRSAALAAVLAVAFTAPAAAGDVEIEIGQTEWELRPGLTTSAWSYGGTVPGRPIVVRVGVPRTLRIYNRDHMSMMMGHRMDHPIHVHGTKSRVLSVNGTAPDQPIWKDTIPVPLGGFVDISFVLENPGDWLFHCHIIDHEDGGMMTFVRAR